MAKETRKAKTFRLAETSITELEALAEKYGVSQTEAIQRAIHDAIQEQHAESDEYQTDASRISDLREQIVFLREQIAIKDEQIANWSKSLQAQQLIQAAQDMPKQLETTEAKEARAGFWQRLKDWFAD